MIDSQRLERVGGVAVAAMVDLVATRLEAGHVSDGCIDHGQPVGSGRDLTRAFLLPRHVGHHQDHDVEL